MNDRAARIVKRAHVEEETVRSPDPVADGSVDEKAPGGHEDEKRGELHAAGDRTRDERGREDREGHLEEDEEEFGNRARKRADADAGKEGLRKAAHGASFREGEGVADEVPEERDHAADRDRLRQS